MKLSFFSIVIFILFTNISFSQSAEKYNKFSGTLNFSFDAGATYSLTDYSGIGIDYLGKATVEYYFPTNTMSAFGLRAFAGGGYVSGSDASFNPSKFRTSISFLGVGVVYNLSISNKIFPLISFGISTLSFNPRGENGQELPNNVAGVYSKSEFNYGAELGLRVKITDNLSTNFGAGIQFTTGDNLDDIQTGTGKDAFLSSTVGLTYSMWGYSDSDNDGVEDSKDMCQDTPPGITVDEFGCPLDTDKDGVPDYIDRCAKTPKGVKVDKNGCPLDSDNDGIPDYTDICPNTPRSIQVDELGCPFDHDADGVPDYLDKCPDTPAKAEVNEKGCPLDTDLDGIPDYLDQCPDSPPGAMVDEKGCIKVKKEKPKEEVKKEESIDIPETKNSEINMVLISGSSFESGKAKLLASSYSELNKVLAVMKKYPLSRWKIESYTDNVGSAKNNQMMSLERANSVLNYFVSKGIPKIRFTIEGFGEKNPVADNKTEAGRAQNRRVVITRVK